MQAMMPRFGGAFCWETEMGRWLRRRFLRWVYGARARGLDIARAAETVTSSNVLFVGVLWATFLALFVSTTEEGLKQAFGLLVVVSSFLFVAATWLQFRQVMSHGDVVASGRAIVASGFMILVGLALLSGVAGMISVVGGIAPYGGDLAQALKSLECAKAAREEYDRELVRLDGFRSDDRRCWLSVQGDVAALNLAVAEKRITEEQRSALIDRMDKRCGEFEVWVTGQTATVRGIAKKKCD